MAFCFAFANYRKASLWMASLLSVACVAFYFSHSYHVEWPW